MIGGRLGELPSQGYTLFDIPRPQVPFVHVHPGAEELGRVYSPHLAIHATPTAFAAALDELKFAPRAVGRRQGCACRLSAMDGQGHRAAGRRQFRRGDGVAARKPARRRHPVQRRRQLCGLDLPLLPLPPLRAPCGAGLGLDGLWRAGRGGDEAALSAAAGRVPCRRRRFSDERPGIRHRRAIRSAVHHHHRRQRHVRHHPHAPGARISRPHFGDRNCAIRILPLTRAPSAASASRSSAPRIFPRRSRKRRHRASPPSCGLPSIGEAITPTTTLAKIRAKALAEKTG